MFVGVNVGGGVLVGPCVGTGEAVLVGGAGVNVFVGGPGVNVRVKVGVGPGVLVGRGGCVGGGVGFTLRKI